jgi:hypothetical protein
MTMTWTRLTYGRRFLMNEIERNGIASIKAGSPLEEL